MSNKRIICLVFLLVLWLILTTILACSVVGWVVIFPTVNNTQYHMDLHRTRSTWMSIGHDLKNKILYE